MPMTPATPESAHELDGPEQLAAFIAAQQARFPPVVVVAYTPSGKIAPGAIGKLAKASLSAAGFAAFLGVLILAASALLIAFAGWLLSLRWGIAIEILIAGAVRWGGPLLGPLIAFGLLSGLPSQIAEAAGRAECRNRSVTVVFALVSVLVAGGVLVGLGVFVQQLAVEYDFGSQLFAPAWLPFTGAALGSALALWSAVTLDLASTAKYCEACARKMDSVKLPRLDLDGLERLRATLAGGEREFPAESASPLAAHAVLSWCRTCQAGYVDADIALRLFYMTLDGNKYETVGWRGLSTPVSPALVTWLRDQMTPGLGRRDVASDPASRRASDGDGIAGGDS